MEQEIKFKKGDRVRIRKESEFYKAGMIEDPIDIDGVVSLLDAGSTYPIVVDWKNRKRNTYRAADLEYAVQTDIEIEGKKLDGGDIGRDVAYFPRHIDLDDWENPEVEWGTISSINEEHVFVRYRGETGQSTPPDRIRWEQQKVSYFPKIE